MTTTIFREKAREWGLTEKALGKIAGREIRSIFGEKYLEAIKGHCGYGAGIVCDGVFVMTLTAKTKDETPWLPEGFKGWTVYAKITLNAETGEVIERDYQTEDGRQGDKKYTGDEEQEKFTIR